MSIIKNKWGKFLSTTLLLSVFLSLFTFNQIQASSAGAKMYVLDYTYDGGLSWGDLDGSNGEEIGIIGGLAYDLAVDVDAGYIYVVSYSENVIYRLSLDGTGQTSLGNPGGLLNSPSSIALDSTNNHLYIANRSGDNIIRTDLNGNNAVNLGNLNEYIDAPMGIAVDPVGGKIYVSCYGPSYLDGNIARADLDGSNAENLGDLGGLVESPRHIDLDTGSGKMYIAEQYGQTILRADLDGINPENLDSNLGYIGSMFGIALDLDASKMYVTTSSSSIVYRANLDGTGIENLGTLNGTLSVSAGIALDTTTPVMDIKGNTMSIADDDDTPSTNDDTDFGALLVDGGTVEHTFTIENTGTADLILDGIPIVSSSSLDYTITSNPATTIAAGGSTPFSVEFNPRDEGTRDGSISINRTYDSDDPYDFDITGEGLVTPQVSYGGSNSPTNGATLSTGPTQIIVEFNTGVLSDGSADAANNTSNYLLVEIGDDNVFNTSSCAGGRQDDDTAVTINSAVYDDNSGSGPYTTTLDINNGIALENGSYRLFICGTTSIEDLYGNTLNNAADDSTLSFTISTSASVLPQTGFAPGRVTLLPAQGKSHLYSTYADISLEIPIIDINAPIVGIPITEDGWDLTWLGDQAGWLHGTAFPTWSGNSSITAHIYDSNGNPGLFIDLETLKWGDKVLVNAYGQTYEYEVRSIEKHVHPEDTSAIFKPEEFPWLTLITCKGYDPESDSYQWRVVVRAVQTGIQ